MKDKIVLVTGATDGIGKQTAFDLARLGATVIVHGRNEQRCIAAVDEIRKETGNNRVEFAQAGLASLEEVRRLAFDIKQQYEKLDVLVNNAGVYMNEFQHSVDGFEMTFAVNHLATFLLTNLLLELLKKSTPSRVITVSSVAHTRGSIGLDDLQGEKTFSPYGAYAASKLANVLFTYELAGRLKGTGVTSNCLHPGVVSTKLLKAGFNTTGIGVKQGAATSVYLASSPDVKKASGKYFVDRRPTQSSPASNNRELQVRLWELSERLTKLD